MPLFEAAVKSIAGCEKLTHLHLSPQFCCLSFQDQPGLARVSFSFCSNRVGTERSWSQVRRNRKKSLPATCSDICLVFPSLSEIRPQLRSGKSSLWLRGCRSLLFILLPTTPHVLWFKSGSCQMIFKKQQISTLNGKETYPKRRIHSWKPLNVHYRFSCACSWSISTVLFQMIATCQVLRPLFQRQQHLQN